MKSIAFTLVELLVVISIIATLAAMLFPSINKAYAYAKESSCANNQKQLSMGIFMYADSNREYYPDANYTDSSSDIDGNATHVNVAILPDIAPGYRNTKLDFNKYRDSKGKSSVFVCPAQKLQSGLAEQYMSYGMNDYLIRNWMYRKHNIYAPVKLNMVRMPTKTYMLTDTIYNISMTMDMGWYLWTQLATGTRHGNGKAMNYIGSSNVIWADGHYTAVKFNGSSEVSSKYTKYCGWTTTGSEAEIK